jgi:predicted nucleotidyltransferase component of viral defense system
MVIEAAIREWNKFYTWQTNEMVEQDLVISRALVALFNDEYLSSHLAFRGGTTLHKLYIQPQQRYSEDIDLVQIKAEPIKETIERFRQTLSFLGKPVIKQKAHNNTLIFRFQSEFPPIMPIRLKRGN